MRLLLSLDEDEVATVVAVAAVVEEDMPSGGGGGSGDGGGGDDPAAHADAGKGPYGTIADCMDPNRPDPNTGDKFAVQL